MTNQKIYLLQCLTTTKKKFNKPFLIFKHLSLDIKNIHKLEKNVLLLLLALLSILNKIPNLPINRKDIKPFSTCTQDFPDSACTYSLEKSQASNKHNAGISAKLPY